MRSQQKLPRVLLIVLFVCSILAIFLVPYMAFLILMLPGNGPKAVAELLCSWESAEGILWSSVLVWLGIWTDLKAVCVALLLWAGCIYAASSLWQGLR